MNETPDRPTDATPEPVDPALEPTPDLTPETAHAAPAAPDLAPSPNPNAFPPVGSYPPPAPDRYSPAPEPRTDWSRPEFASDRPVWPVQPAPVWHELAPGGHLAAPTPPRRRGVGVAGPIVAASLLSAVLASGGTYLALSASGAFDQPAATSQSPGAAEASGRQPVTIDESSATIAVAAKVGPAVVKITTGAAAAAGDPIPETGVGSGVIFDAKGWILTNRHVVAGSDKLTVELEDGRQLEGSIYGIDTLTDLAIVKVDATGLPTAALGDSDALKVGQLTIAIGSPLGTYSNSVTSGILSAKGRMIDVEGGRLTNLLQTDTAINPGNSGGPLLDASGAVIGINTAIASSAEGIGFAIPINLAKPIMDEAVAGEALARPYIGVRFDTIDLQVVERENLSVKEGALVTDAQAGDGSVLPAIVPGGPADRAGVLKGDIITKIGDITLDGEHPLDAVISQFSPGEKVPLTIVRDGATTTVEVTLGTRPADL